MAAVAAAPVESGGGPPDFGLSEEVMAVLPSDPFEQLDVARKITSIALAFRVSRLESETARLRQRLTEKDDFVADLRAQLETLDASLADLSHQLAQSPRREGPLLLLFPSPSTARLSTEPLPLARARPVSSPFGFDDDDGDEIDGGERGRDAGIAACGFPILLPQILFFFLCLNGVFFFGFLSLLAFTPIAKST